MTGAYTKSLPSLSESLTPNLITATLSELSTMTLPGHSIMTFPVSSTIVTTDAEGDAVGGLQAFSIMGPLVQLNHKSSDLPSTATALGPISTASNQSATSHQTKSTLTTEAKIAIGVLVPITVLSLLAFFTTFLVRQRKRDTILRPADDPHHRGEPELEARNLPEAPQDAQISELIAFDHVHELESAPRHELPMPNSVHELEGASSS